MDKKSDYVKTMETQLKKWDAAQKTFQELPGASESAGAKMQAGMEVAWDTMQKSPGKSVGGSAQMKPAVAAAVLAFACGTATAAGMTKADYEAAKKPIAAEYRAERQKCGARHGNAADLCIARAHGTRDVAKAELEAAFKPSPRTNYGAAIARARAAYTIARQECDNVRGQARKDCVRAASNAQERAKADARFARDRIAPG